ncbi:histone-lysine N-methyltransferase 2A isoform X1 [Salmo salar]|uniref:Histone-lysine N-methyltransferase n=1 Tax=Salmo salar TaxID=8030 RepID=A0ABM3DKV8_SALSA|nr:histone-lysine N-methyltransferase 2A isoform X1 [Salmo salar]
MAHSCRWRFPARPGGSSNLGTGRRAGRIRVTASLRSSTGTHPNTAGLGPGFDAALQVSSAIGCNLQKFRDVLGESSGSSSGEEGAFGGFGTVSEHRRMQSQSRTLAVTPTQEKKPRGRPPRAQTAQKGPAGAGPSPSPASGKPEGQEWPVEKAKRLPGRPPGSGEKRRGRPPASGTQRSLQACSHTDNDSRQVGQEYSSTTAHRKDRDEERKATKRTPLGSVQQHDTEAKPPKASRESKVTKLKRLREVKLSPLKAIARKCVPVPGVPRRRRGRPPSAERLKAEAAAAQASGSEETKQKSFSVRRDRDTDPHTPQQQSKLRVSHFAEEDDNPDVHSSSSPLPSSSPSKLGRPLNLRTSPRHIKPVRIVPPSKRTDAAIAKQLLQRAKKGAQKKKLLEKEVVAIGVQGAAAMEAGIRRRRRTQLKNIRQFIMPVVSTVSLRIIKTPKRFIEDEGSFGASHPHMKMARLDAVPPPVAAPQPASASSPMRAAAVTTAAAKAVTAAPVDTIPLPPPTVTPSRAMAVAASLLNNSCNNSTSNGRFSSSVASCGSSAVSLHSSQLSSGESSRSSSPSLDDSSCDSQASEGTQALSEHDDEHDDERDHSPSSQGEREADMLHTSRHPSEPEPEQRVLIERGRRGRRGQGVGRGSLGARRRGSLATGGKKAIISPATGVLMSNSQQAASSSSSPPPASLLSSPQQAQSGSNMAEHHPHSPWILPHPFLQGQSLVLSSLQDKRRSILREPTFRWTSRSRTDQQYFSSAKYAKEGLIRKPIFDNFRPPPLTAQDVGLMPHGAGAGGVAPAGYPAPGSGGGTGAGTRLFSPLHHHHHHQQHPSSRFESPLQKRGPLLRAPRFTPSEAHSRIFESVTLQSSSGSSPGSLSPLQSSPKSGRSVRRKKRTIPGPLRGQPRSPSHSMTTRSSQPGAPPGKGPSELSVLTGSISTGASSTSNSSSSLPTSALTPAPFSTFSPGPLGLSTHGPSSSDGHRAAGSRGGGAGGNSASCSSSQLFSLFTSSPQEMGRGAGKGGKERSASASRESAPVKEKERETEKSREREKENKREGRKDWERRGKASTPEASPNRTPSLFAGEGREGEESLTSLAPKKTPGRKKSVPESTGTEAAPVDRAAVHSSIPLILTKGRLSKKNRPSERGPEAEPGEKEKTCAPAQQTGLPPVQTGSKKPPAIPSLGSMLAHAEKQPVADKRVAGLLKKAKAQLFKIEKSKSLKSPDHPKVQSHESDSSETSVRGPRIKHVCRRAAVALGRNRAVFPDDMPTLSALPWEEREKILSSMGNDDKSSVAGSEEAEPQSPPIKPVMRHTKIIQEGGAAPRKGRRSRRCRQCPGCQVPDDCGVCTNCLDKPKFGGRNIKKQCCKVRKCQNLQWMPSKTFLKKQVKGKKYKKKNKLSEKKEALHPVKGPTSTEPSLKQVPPPLKEEPPRKKSVTPPLKPAEEKQKQSPPQLQSPTADNPTPPNDQAPSCTTAPGQDQKHPATSPTGAANRKERKPQQPTPPSSPSSFSSSSSSSLQSSPSPPTPQPQQPPQQHQRPQPTQGTAKKEGAGASKSPPTEAKRKPQQQSLATPITDTAPEGKQMKKQASRSVPPPPKSTKPKEKQQKPLATKPESSTLNLLSTPSTGGTAKQKVPCDGVHRIRVDFKKDHDVENVWATGGLGLLTSVPITPRVVCFLCASSGNVEFVFCQVCCEPFHLFCLGETERPLEEQWENWCCRRCRFCHTCGLQHQKTKQQLLECEKCRNSYHPECLGPNHPTRPTKKKRVWICTKCVRCKSCGATKPGKAWDAQWSHDFSLCHDCAKLFAKGNFCPLCDKCYDDDDYDSKMMQCGRCDHWVHSKCENLTDEMYELLSNLPESVAYTCTNCTKRQPAEWRTALEKELQGLVRQVLTALLNSRTSTHLLRYRQAVMKPPELNPETEESLPTRRSPEGPDPPVLTEVKPPNDSPLDLESVEKKLVAGRYKSVLEFSDDIVKIIQMAINSDGGQPENRKANSMVKSFFIRQMERLFPWFKVKESRFWETHKFSTNSGLLPNAVLPPSLDHNYAQWQEREEIARAGQPLLRKKIIPAPCPKTPGEPDSPPPPRPLLPQTPPMLHDLSCEDSPELLPPPGVSDNRQCVLCLKYGDDNTNEGGRLLYIGQNEWTHVNCALWSAEVFEDDDGSLKNVHMAVIRGKQLRCENCQRPGATVGCCLTSCTRNYHFMCARQRHCVFLEDKKVYCQRHRDLIKGEVVSESGFEVTRRILVDLEGISLRRKFLTGLQPENIHMMIGSMTIDCLGILTELSDCERKLFPIGYQCSRVYWSTLDARKRCVYTCRILVCRPTVVEPDLKSALPEENRTISHSPFMPILDKVLSPVPDPFDSLKPSNRLSLLPSSPNPPKVYTRNRHPSYPPCQRSPGSRPLPSPGGSSQSAHEIVTVGDPLLSSGLRSIGSRRHSTSSLSPQPRQKVVSPPQAGVAAAMNQLALLSSSTPPPVLSSSSASRDLGLRDTEKPPASGVRTQSRETSSLSPGGQHRHHHSISEMKTDGGKESAPGKQAVGENPKLSPMAPGMAGASQASPPPGTGLLTGHQRASNSKSQAEKGKQGGKVPDLSAGVTLLSRHCVTTTLSKDRGGGSSSCNPAKEGSVTLAQASKDSGKLGYPQPLFHKSVGRKSQDYLSGPAPAVAMKPLWSSGAEDDVIKRSSQAAPAVPSSHSAATTKDKHSKVRTIDSREASKEREKTPQNSNKNPTLNNNNAKETGGTTNAPTPTSQNCNSKAATLSNNTKAIGKQEVEKLENQGKGRSSKSRERFSSPEKNSSSLEAIKPPRLASERSMRASQVQARVTANEVAAARDKKRAIVKASLTPLKTDPNGTNTVSASSDSCTTTSICPVGLEGPPHRRSSCSTLFSPSACSESSESNSPPLHPEDREEKRLLARCTEHEGTSDRDDHALLEEEGGDGDKRHEDDSDCSGSAKRRYPRRSARARSNMFFGLTPFYGVRSYGEEDIPFYSSSGDGPGKRKAGGSRRSAEGQVDGADDRSNSSSGDSGEEEEGGFNQCSNKDPYYYNFTRTIINPGPVMPSIEGIDQCLGRGSQLQRFLKNEKEERVVAAVDGVPTRSLLSHQQIGQLDGVDDSSESDASASTTNTTTTATAASSSHKSTGKRKGRERHMEKLERDSGKEADNSSGGGGSSGSSSNNSREGRKSQKDSSLPLGGVKSSQRQDPLEAQLSLSTDLLKSDSDNNNSDDCGNILPSDIMEFVLNTPSMQALGQQPEASSSELLSLDEGYGVGVNRRKDILFEDFPQPLASAEPVESGVSTSISVEEPYGLPLELPSDLSVLTTRSPTVNNQNHGGLISEGSERTILSLAASDDTIAEKGGEDKQQRGGAGVSPESQQEGSGGSRESQVRKGHMTPEQFEHITSPSLGQVVDADNQDLTRSSGTPVLPSTPTLPLQGQKYIPAASSVSPGPSQVASMSVQTTSHLKPGPEKLIVVNQHLQPLYVLQTLPNGVTQKIQITPSVSATGVMDTMTLTTGLTTGITTSQPIFPAGGKVLGTMSHHPQIHTFTGTTQTGFQPGIPSTTSGLLIGVPSHEPQILVTEAGRRHDLAPNVTIVSSAASISTSSAVLASGHGKKRPISRLQPRKTKKLARSRSQPTLAPSEVRPNMTLINLSSPQIAQSGLVELGTLTTAATTSHRNVPNIIKRPKSGVMYFEPIQRRRPLPSGQPSILGHDSSTHLLPCTVSGLNPNQSAVLNMVSMAQPSGPGGLIAPGSVSLSTPVLSSAEITGPISSLLFKATPHNLGLPEQQMLLQSGAPLMSQLCSPAQTSIASSICVIPSHQTISMSVSQQVDPESRAFQRQQHPPNASGQPVALAPSPVSQDSGKGHLVGVFPQSSRSQSSSAMPISRSSSEQKQELKCSAAATAFTGSGKGKQKAKRMRQSPDKASGKKHKGWQTEPPRETQGDRAPSTPGSREPVSPESMDTGKPRDRGTCKSKTSEFPEEKGETAAGSLLVATPDQEGSRRDSSMDSKPKKGLIFEICSDDGFQIRCESIEEAWKSLTDKVQEARSNARLKELSFEGVNGLRMLGVLHDAVVFLLEQLYGSRHCRSYRFRFHKPEEADKPPLNPHGSARAELHHRRSVFDMFNFLASKHRQPPEYNPHEEDEEVQLKSARRATSMDLPMPMRFRHLKKTSKEAVGVFRSAIHGRGLFCKRSIDVGEMVIEYSGNVIRSVLTDKREKYYDGKGVGCYMFRIDDYEVVDATVHGNAARFINHSCEPNCYSRVINVDGQKHIVIFATRKIYRGEELTYDYKFPIEEPGNKLPCNCGTKKCRKFLN